MSEWIKWDGGNSCPAEKGRIVDVIHRDGDEYLGVITGEDYAVDWDHNGGPGDIVAYRLHQQFELTADHYDDDDWGEFTPMHIKFKRLHPDTKEPTYATDGAACMDVRALHGGWIEPGESALFSTGLAFEVPQGYAMFIDSRSGHGFNHGVRLSNSLGILDSDFRGELMVKLHNDGWERVTVNAGDRIAQFMIVEAPKFKLVEVDELSATDRGVNGLGSTGKA